MNMSSRTCATFLRFPSRPIVECHRLSNDSGNPKRQKYRRHASPIYDWLQLLRLACIVVPPRGRSGANKSINRWTFPDFRGVTPPPLSSSKENLPEIVMSDSSHAPAIGHWDLADIEAIIDSWFPHSAEDPQLIDSSHVTRKLNRDHSVQLPFSPPFVQSTEDPLSVMHWINEVERFTELPSTMTWVEPSIASVAALLAPHKKR